MMLEPFKFWNLLYFGAPSLQKYGNVQMCAAAQAPFLLLN